MAAIGHAGHVGRNPAAPPTARVRPPAADPRLALVHGVRSPASLLALQRAAGNRATVALLADLPQGTPGGPVVQRLLDANELRAKADLEGWMAAYAIKAAAAKGRKALLAALAPDTIVRIDKARRLAALNAKALLPSDEQQAADTVAAAAAATARVAAAEAERQAAAARAASDAAATTAAKATFGAQIATATGSVAAVAARQTAALRSVAAVPLDRGLRQEPRVAARLRALEAAVVMARGASQSAANVTGTTLEVEANAFQAAGTRAVADATAAEATMQGEIDKVQTKWLLSAQTDHTAAAKSIARGYLGTTRLSLNDTYVSGPDIGKGYGGEYWRAGGKWVVHVHRTMAGLIYAATTKPSSNPGLAVGVDISLAFRDRLATIGVPVTDTNAGSSFKRNARPPNTTDPQPDLDSYRTGH